MITTDRRSAAAEIARRTHTALDDIMATPFLCLGTHGEIAEHLLSCRERWGISYYSVRDIDAFGPVIEQLNN